MNTLGAAMSFGKYSMTIAKYSLSNFSKALSNFHLIITIVCTTFYVKI